MRFDRFLKDVAAGVGDILVQHFNRVSQIERKENAGIVTEVDHLAEAYVLKRIEQAYPNSSVITEESGEFQRDQSLCWVIDPLDGTSNYAHGFPWFCVSIGLMENGIPTAGIVYQPISKELFYAERGRGAYVNDAPMRVSSIERLEDSLLGTGFYYTKGDPLREEVEIFRRVNEVALGVRRPGSAALDMAFVAAGRYEAFWERGLAAWDVAAGFVLVTEAGGQITNYRGESVSIHDRELIASNGRLHPQMVSLVRGG